MSEICNTAMHTSGLSILGDGCIGPCRTFPIVEVKDVLPGGHQVEIFGIDFGFDGTTESV